MPSVKSIDRQKASTVFRSVENSHVRDVLPVVEDRLREALNGEETLPDLPVLTTLLGRVQATGTQRLIAADAAHEEELVGDVESRLLREEVGGRVRKKLVEIRRFAAGVFGPERSAEVLGAPGATATLTEGERLWRQAEDTVKRLEDPGFTVPVMTTASLQFDPAQLAAELASDNDAFREALDAVALEQRKAETTLEVKNARHAEATRIERACGRIYEGFFLLADRPDLLDRFRRALRRHSRRAAPITDDASPVPDEGPIQDDEPPQGGEPSEGEPSEGEPSESASSAD